MATFTDAQLEAIAKNVYARPQTIVPYLVGMWIDAALMGVVFIMSFQWVRLGWQVERRFTRVLVTYLFLANMVISGFILHAQIDKFAMHYGKYAAFLNPEDKRKFWILASASRTPTGLFFAHRAWLISGRSIFIPLIVIPLSLTSIGAAIGAYFVATEAITPKGSTELPLVTLFCCCGLAVDMINTVTIAVGLYRSRTGWRTTDSIINLLLLKTAETQLPPTIASLSFLMCFLGWPNNTFAFMWQGITKIHVICLLVVISSRFKLRNLANSGSGSYVPDVPTGKLDISIDSDTHNHSTPHELTDLSTKPAQRAPSEHRDPSVDEAIIRQNEDRIWITMMNSRTSLV